jgi:hypothetical protein
MKISPYTSYLKMQPNALLISIKFYYLQKVGVTPWPEKGKRDGAVAIGSWKEMDAWCVDAGLNEG